jgi:hypothetical protein
MYIQMGDEVAEWLCDGLLDKAVADFKAVTGGILNRYRKSVIVGLGTREGRAGWPLGWPWVTPHVKVYGFTYAPSHSTTILCVL